MVSGSSNHSPEVHEFIASLQLDQFCDVASSLRTGSQCHPGKHIIGGFNVLQELVFSDGTIWLARIPIPSNCFQLDECLLSYVAVLKYVKKHSQIPVPQIYHHALQSDPDNLTGTTYLMMEKLPGHELPTLEPDEDNDIEDDSGDDWTPEKLRITRKVHEQLTDLIVELASFKFDKIGSLRENAQGEFFVAEYVDPNTTVFPKERAEAFKNLASSDRGPFSTVSKFYHAQCVLGKEHARIDPEEEEYRAEMIEDFETLETMIPHFKLDEYENGPFVLAHNDLTVQNILVDDELNITGIIDFPGTIVPVQSLCVYPWLFHDNYIGPVANRELYYEVFTTREASNPSSLLASKEMRRSLLDTAGNRGLFERSLEGVYTPATLPVVYEAIYGKSYRQKDDADQEDTSEAG